MLKIENINVAYENTLFQNAHFVCIGHNITVVTGEKGSGKSTLLDMIALQRDGYQTYTFNEKEVQRDFLVGRIYYAKQEPLFEEDLTIKDNIDMLYHIFHMKRDMFLEEKLLKELELENSLDKYGSMLTEAERKRLSLLFAIISQRDIILLDEPTAFVDLKMSQKMIKLIEYYLSSRMTVITTQDQNIIKIADVIYHIKNHILQRQGDIYHIHMPLKKVKIKDTISYYWKIVKHRRVYYILKYLFTALMICGIVLGLVSRNEYLSIYKEMLEQKTFDDITVYQPLWGEDYGYSGDEFPLSSETVEKLSQLDYIKEIKPMYLFSDYNVNYIYHNDQEIFMEGSYVEYIGYDEKKDNSSYLRDNFSTEGIYISASLADKLGFIQSGDLLTFQLPVPQYNVFNEGYIINAENERIEIVSTNENFVSVTLPIAGIVNSGYESLGMTFPVYEYIVYLPRTFMEEQLKQNQVFDSYNEGEIIYKPYQPNAYIVTLSSQDDIPQFQQDLENMNLILQSSSIELSSIVEEEETLEQRKLFMIGSLVSISLIAICIMKYKKRKKDLHFYEYLLSLTQQSQYVKKIYFKNVLLHFLLTFLLSTLLLFIFVIVLSRMMIYITTLSLVTVLICFVVTVIFEGIQFIISYRKFNHILKSQH